MSREQAGILRGRGHVGRASRAPGKLWQAPLFLLGVLAFSAVAATAPSRRDQAPIQFAADIAALRHGLEPDQEKAGVLVARAENMLARLSQYPRRAGEIHFLAGSAYFRQSAQCAADSAEANRKKALYHLEEALALGTPPGDQHPLQFRLGLMLHQQGKDSRRALDLMAQSVDKGADRPAQGYGILVQAYLAQSKPSIDAALAASQKQLELTDDRNVEEMARARLMRGDLLLRKDQRPDALKELERVGAAAPKELRLKARLMQAQICEESGLWTRAVPVWQELLKDADAVPEGKARVLHALGLAHLNGEPARPDKAVVHWQDAFALGGDYGQAAGLRLGELKLYADEDNIKPSLEIWGKVLEAVRSPSDYGNKALELSRARQIFDNACKKLLDGHRFEQTQQVAELYKKIALPGSAEERIAQAAEALAADWQARLAGADDKIKAEEVRAQYHRAAVAFEQAAIARADDGQADSFWRSAQCYLSAKDFARAGAVLDRFVLLDKNETRLAEGWLALAEANAAQGNKDKARQAYYKCIEFPQTRFAFLARYQLALDEMQKKSYEQARDILQQNLAAAGPVVDKAAHEKSIYKMGELAFLMNDYDKSAMYYKEAVKQYPDNAAVLPARDQLGECFEKLADQAKRRLDSAKDEESKGVHKRTRQKWLEEAASAFQALADQLERQARQKSPLPPSELGQLRKSLFKSADLRFEMNELAEALRRYQTLQEKYRKQVEGLIACQRIWRCVGVMVSPEQSRLAREGAIAAVKAAQADLETMPEDSDAFRGTGVWTKDNWQRWLRWVGDQLNPPPTPPRPTAAIQ